MSSDVSIVIRAVDMTRAAFGRVRAGLGTMAKQARGIFGGMGGGLGGIAGGAGGLFALSRAIRAATSNAQELRDNMDLTPELRRNVDAVNIMSDAFGKLKVGFVNGLTGILGTFYRGMFRVRAMMGGASLAESGDMADQALTDYGPQSDAAAKLREQMQGLADAKADYAAEQKGEQAVLDRLIEKQESIKSVIAETSKLSQERVDAELSLLEVTKKIDKVKESIAAKDQQAIKAAQELYERDQERQAKYEQENFDQRKSAADKIRDAVMTPLGLQRLMKEERKGEKEDAKWARLVVKAQEKQKKIMSGRTGLHLTKKESAILMASEMNQQDQAIGKNIAGVEENTRKMLEALVENLRLK